MESSSENLSFAGLFQVLFKNLNFETKLQASPMLYQWYPQAKLKALFQHFVIEKEYPTKNTFTMKRLIAEVTMID